MVDLSSGECGERFGARGIHILYFPSGSQLELRIEWAPTI